MIGKIAFERMQTPTSNIHAPGVLCRIQSRELNFQLIGMSGLDSGFASGKEELLQTRVPERPNHVFNVACNASCVKEKLQETSLLPGSFSTSGTQNRKQVPCPGRLAASIPPPCAMRMARVIASPIPDPFPVIAPRLPR
jgi:hypothetical protein